MGVDPYLVAYWRRKKNIQAHSYAKYSETQIKELWERFGVDTLAGDSLGISGNAFRYWRHIYGLKEKPERLKLEQIQLPLPGFDPVKKRGERRSFILKIINNKSKICGESDKTGIKIEPDKIYFKRSDHNGYDIMTEKKFRASLKPHRIFSLIDENPCDGNGDHEFKGHSNAVNLTLPSDGGMIFDAISKGHILPGEFVISTDPSVIGVGAVGAVGIHLENDSLLDVLEESTINISLNNIVRITLLDTPYSVCPIDIILNLQVNNNLENFYQKAVEFTGSTIDNLNLERRFTLCYLSKMLGFRTSGISCDKEIERILRKKALLKFKPSHSDPGANYEIKVRQSVLEMEPVLGKFSPNSLDICSVSQEKGKDINTIITGFYSGGMYNDISEIASFFRKQGISSKVRFYIRPATSEILLKIIEDGLMRQLVQAGCYMLHPSTDFSDISVPSIRPEMGTIMVTDPAALEIIPENYPHPVYIANHQVAALSSTYGKITDPFS
ncbi:MAG: hypothetical protein GY855_17140 [candidate division Zixibacteria bacterium]|nr:hypothetical protein [candidate division Zixibacteria bacterium]